MLTLEALELQQRDFLFKLGADLNLDDILARLSLARFSKIGDSDNLTAEINVSPNEGIRQSYDLDISRQGDLKVKRGQYLVATYKDPKIIEIYRTESAKLTKPKIVPKIRY